MPTPVIHYKLKPWSCGTSTALRHDVLFALAFKVFQTDRLQVEQESYFADRENGFPKYGINAALVPTPTYAVCMKPKNHLFIDELW